MGHARFRGSVAPVQRVRRASRVECADDGGGRLLCGRGREGMQLHSLGGSQRSVSLKTSLTCRTVPCTHAGRQDLRFWTTPADLSPELVWGTQTQAPESHRAKMQNSMRGTDPNLRANSQCKSTSEQSEYARWQPERVGMRTACGDCSRCAFLERCHQ